MLWRTEQLNCIEQQARSGGMLRSRGDASCLPTYRVAVGWLQLIGQLSQHQWATCLDCAVDVADAMAGNE